MIHRRGIAIAIALGLAFGVGLVLAASGVPSESSSQSCCRGAGRGMGPGMRGMSNAMDEGDESHAEDMEVFHFLLDHRDAIRRDVRELPDGIESVTESDDPEVAAVIREHVAAMYRRVKENRPIHARDPLFAEIFRHSDAIEMEMTATAKGLRVKETSADPYVAELIKAHAKVVDAFMENGHMEMRKNHPLPER